MIQPVGEEQARCGLLYEQVATRIATLIEKGTLRPGERIPSIRAVRRHHGVSMATAMQAYRMLENRGVIEARPQSGFYVRTRSRPQPVEPAMSRPSRGAALVTTGDLVLRFLRSVQDPSLVSLGAALPGFDLLPLRQLGRTLASVVRRSPVLANRYDVSPGTLPLRTQVARRAMAAGCTLSPDDVVITNGCQEALYLCLQAVARRGDTIAVESPTYFGLLQMLASLGLKACEIPTYPREGVCLDALEERLDSCRIKACLFMLNFSNPLGSCMPDGKKARLVALLAKRGIPLIEDDIYGDLSFAPDRPQAAKSHDRAGGVLLCNSFCKTLAPGYQVGWVAPGRFRDQVADLKFVSSMGTATVTQLAIADFLANSGFEHHLRRLRRAFRKQMELVSLAVSRHFPEGTKITRPQGGFVLWVELPAHVDSIELFERALAHGISLAPGPVFAARKAFRNCIRLNCGLSWTERVEAGLARLGKLVAAM